VSGDGQEEGVMKTSILGTILLACLLFAMTAAADNETQRKTLAGLQAVYVTIETLDSEVERDGLSESAIQTDVELKLRQAGIPVLTHEQWLRTPGKAWLYLNVNVHKEQSWGGYVYGIKLHLIQEVTLTRAPRTITDAATWEAVGKVGIAGQARLSSIRDSAKDMVDQFINAHLAANPKK